MKAHLQRLYSDLGRIAVSGSLLALCLLLSAFELSVPTFILALAALLYAGIPIYTEAVRGILRRDLLDEKFLMSIASIGAFFLGDYTEAVAVLVFFTIGEYFEHRAIRSSRMSIRSLMDIRPDTATVLRDGTECTVDADEVALSETVIVRTGERVSVDGVILSGSADLDTSALTGESVPRAVSIGDSVESGTVVLSGVFHMRCVRVADDSAASRILSLVEEASERKSKEESFITRFSRVYTPVVVIFAVLFAIIPAVFSWLPFSESLSRALTFLVISCPCALVISVPMAFFGGIGGAASRGILFKGGNTFSALARAKIYAFDKTGTLTSGKFHIVSVDPAGIGEDAFLRFAAAAEYGSNHPIAQCIKAAAANPPIPTETDERSGEGIVAVVEGHRVALGNRRLMDTLGIPTEANCLGGTLHMAIDGQYRGTVRIADTVKDTSADAIRELYTLGVERGIMLSGDSAENVRAVGDALGLGELHAGLLPDEKYARLEELISTGLGVVYVGDGINDAPSIARADVGIAMGSVGQDSAIEAADVVIMSDNLMRIPAAVRIARKTLAIAKQNIVFALTVKLVVLLLGVFGIANMWLAVFADVGVSLLAILNAMRTLKS